MELLSKSYDPKGVEERWQSFWLERGYFKAEDDSPNPPFCIVIPPPNVTGSLHMGHALNNTLQDIVTRFRRMQGYNTLWLPGTDHAGIATQNVVERMLLKEGLGREELGREKFLERVWRWKEEAGKVITGQLKRLGASCDWSRERFTLDAGFSRAVQEAFITLYREGLIYRGDYVINWCPRCKSALSDLETESAQIEGDLYYVDYPLAGGEGRITVATTRPETIPGDVAVAVHPDDERYRHLVGREALLPVMGRLIPIIADPYVDPEFGTGVLKITPAHDFNDFEVALRHDLSRPRVMDESARMSDLAGKYRGLDRYECRKVILRDLEHAGLLRRVERYIHTIGHCYRCKTVVEPYLSQQWFVKTRPLAIPAVEAVRRGETKIIPQYWENTYFDWMNNIRDWCISRQIWWGHRIPAWHCLSCHEVTVATQAPESCPACGGELKPESDVLDTWFSSALWPFATLGWPQRTKALDTFYPTSVLVTGFDILFFWVARMMMMGIKFMGKVPFREVYIHALVRDAEGQKMSKSRGNVIDPLEMMERYGTDAFRFTLAAFAAQGRDIRLSEARIAGYRNFCNKIWNAARFTLMNLEGIEPADFRGRPLELAERWILSRLARTIQEVVEHLEGYRFNEGASAIYQFFWHEFCDWYIEAIKPSLAHDADPMRRNTAQNILTFVFETSLRLLHPFIPFMTEEIWQRLPHQGESITVAPYPRPSPELIDEDAEGKMGLLMGVIRAIRNIRGELSIPPLQRLEAILVSQEEATLSLLKEGRSHLFNLAHLSGLSIGREVAIPRWSVSSLVSGVEVFVPLEGLVDFQEELKRLDKEEVRIKGELSRVEGKLADANFLGRAPEDVVEKEREKAMEFKEKLKKINYWRERITRLVEQG